MGTLLDDDSLSHHDNLVSIDNGTESVSDHNHSEALLLEQLVKSLLDLMLTLSIEGRGSLVKEQDSGLPDQGPCDRDALLLATRETTASLTDLGIEAIREQDLILEEATAGHVESFLQTSLNLLI